MQQYIYPAILYQDNETKNYSVAFNDLDVFTEGNAVEDAFKSAKDFLKAYLRCSLMVYGEMDKPTSYIDVKNEHRDEIVLLVDAEFDEKEKTGFVDDIFDD